MKIQSHPQRDRAWQELHTRPFVRFPPPAHVLHLAFLRGEETKDADDENLARLIEAMSLTATYESPKHSIHAVTLNELGRLVLCWERHNEYTAFTFFFYELKKNFNHSGSILRRCFRPDGCKASAVFPWWRRGSRWDGVMRCPARWTA